ncbi:MAG: ABC transporter substrate-binding protein [Thermoanaerobaculia bacterium]
MNGRTALAAVALALAFASNAAGQGPAPVVIGLLVPPEETEGISVRRGAELAVAEANEMPGPPLKLAVRGRKGTWGSDATEAARLLEEDGAAALLAPPGGAATHLVLQVAGRTGVPVASLCPDGSVTRTALPWMVRVSPSTADEARVIFSGTGATRWLAFVPPARAGREAGHDLQAAAPKGQTVKAVETAEALEPPETLRTLLSSLRPDGVLLWLDPATAGRLARALRAAGFAGVLAGPSRLVTPAFEAAAGSAAEGLAVAVSGNFGAVPHAGFERRYRDLFGSAPDITAALAHDAAALLIGLVRPGGAEVARRAFPLTRTFPGSTGLLSFDGSGNRVVSLELRRYRDGRLVRV